MASGATNSRIVFVMAADAEQAVSIARTLVEESLAACVNIVGPVRSIYKWRGAIEDQSEHMLVIKTRAALFGKVERRVRELHSYEVPEIIALPISAGSAPYLAWIGESTKASVVKPSKARAQSRNRNRRRSMR
jgi:periplasmic divalent cation tolerance protein